MKEFAKKYFIILLMGFIAVLSYSSTADAASIEEQVVYDENGVKITANGLDMDGFYGPEINLLIENNLDEDICVQIKDSAINGCMMQILMSADVAAGKKSNEAVGPFRNDLEAAGIQEISSVEVSFHVVNSNYETLFDTEVLEIKTDLEDYVQDIDDSGDVVYDANDIKIVSKGLSEDSIGRKIDLLYIENNSDRYICVQARDTSVNGFMIDPWMSSSIFPHKVIFTDIGFLQSDLEENKIDSIEEIETVFHVFDPETYETLFDTESIIMSF